jgi:hypothetical protein
MPSAASSRRSAASGLTRGQQILVAVVIALTGIAGVQLFVLADATATYFAWTVSPPVAAAFLGAGYWSVAIAAGWGLRTGDWRGLLPLAPGAVATTTLVLAATLLHLDRFHLGATAPGPLLAAWVWLIVYLIVPPVLTLLWIGEIRKGSFATRTAGRPLRLWVRSGYAAVAVVVGLVAVLLFLAPGSIVWPWTLTPLTSRATGAFLAGMALAATAVAIQNDLGRVRFAAAALLGFAALEVLSLVRFASTVSFGMPNTWAWLTLMIALIVLAATSLRDAALSGRRSSRLA